MARGGEGILVAQNAGKQVRGRRMVHAMPAFAALCVAVLVAGMVLARVALASEIAVEAVNVADTAAPAAQEAPDLTDVCSIEVTLPEGVERTFAASTLTNGNHNGYATLPAGTSIAVVAPEGGAIAALYVLFDYPPEPWALTVAGHDGAAEERTCGAYGIIHECVEGLEAHCATLTFAAETRVCEIYAFGAGALPGWVERWQPPEGRADVLFCPTHADDDQLYLCGIIPTAINAGYTVQVAYFCNHWETHCRQHEMLAGLWHSGLVRYPFVSPFEGEMESTLDLAIAAWERKGITEDFMVGMQVELLRRYQPQVVVEHDIDGEYGHTAHMMNVRTMMKAVPLAADAAQYLESAEQYGTWDVPKMYIHLYKEGAVTLNLDKPLASFGGKTAFQLSQEAFRLHRSQQVWTVFCDWLYQPAKASDIRTESPCSYGLWRSTVGPDEQGDTLFEHISSYAVQEQQEAERAERAENIKTTVVCVAVVLIALAGSLALRRLRKG